MVIQGVIDNINTISLNDPGTTFASDGSGGVIVTDVMPQAPEPPAHSLRPGRRRRSDSVGANG